MEKIEKKIKPQWLELLLNKRFFGVCQDHKETRKSEINIYCIECDLCLCSHCIVQDLAHRPHRLLQIRRYVYQDVVRVHDLQKLIDCSRVQTYTVNSAKVVLLNSRKQSKPSKLPPGSVECMICHRFILEPNRYCSIACKVCDQSSVEISKPENKSGPLNTATLTTPVVEELKEDGSPSSSPSSQPPEFAEENPEGLITEPVMVNSFRKRPRKGIPCRSPMF